MKILILAACVAVSAAFIPGERPACNADNVEGGSILLAHENYCQLFYACNGDQQSFPMSCPDGFLFTYANGLANCLLPSDDQVTCVNWPCTQLDVGNRFPDTCCGKYWQCVSPGQYEQRTCPNGQRFNALTENCDFN
ncbi:uncharacterized protein LOC101845322, partial [Aplysia californica]|uniref:Uncharacterized protein LOC101845322 n=1 Tax=Aplysia californica TaxID=6500 RepID=A0ABM0ZZJ8_APLCA